jgi:FtsH-binding integral membrane protein
MENKVFDRTGSEGEIISAGLYNFIIGLVLCWGFLVNWIMVQEISPQSVAAIDFRVFFIGYFACCFLGIYLFNKYDNPYISFLGYNLVVIPFGFIVNIVVSRYDSALVLEAIRITGMVTVIMMVLGSLYPRFFQKIAGALTMALFIVIVVELVEIFVFSIHHGIIDWIVVLLFCGYIGYDWARANVIPKTVDNAIDSAAALYMDIINLFLRILRILGRKK